MTPTRIYGMIIIWSIIGGIVLCVRMIKGILKEITAGIKAGKMTAMQIITMKVMAMDMTMPDIEAVVTIVIKS